MFLVDDGSDQDYDSHIMVWQLPIVPPDAIVTTTSSDTTDHNVTTTTTKDHESRASSSLDLGPTPGSGVITVDSDDDHDDEMSKLPENFGNDSGNDSYKNWNKDVESLLQHVAVSNDDDDQLQIRSSPDGGEE